MRDSPEKIKQIPLKERWEAGFRAWMSRKEPPPDWKLGVIRDKLLGKAVEAFKRDIAGLDQNDPAQKKQADFLKFMITEHITDEFLRGFLPDDSGKPETGRNLRGKVADVVSGSETENIQDKWEKSLKKLVSSASLPYGFLIDCFMQKFGNDVAGLRYTQDCLEKEGNLSNQGKINLIKHLLSRHITVQFAKEVYGSVKVDLKDAKEKLRTANIDLDGQINRVCREHEKWGVVDELINRGVIKNPEEYRGLFDGVKFTQAQIDAIIAFQSKHGVSFVVTLMPPGFSVQDIFTTVMNKSGLPFNKDASGFESFSTMREIDMTGAHNVLAGTDSKAKQDYLKSAWENGKDIPEQSAQIVITPGRDLDQRRQPQLKSDIKSLESGEGQFLTLAQMFMQLRHYIDFDIGQNAELACQFADSGTLKQVNQDWYKSIGKPALNGMTVEQYQAYIHMLLHDNCKVLIAYLGTLPYSPTHLLAQCNLSTPTQIDANGNCFSVCFRLGQVEVEARSLTKNTSTLEEGLKPCISAWVGTV